MKIGERDEKFVFTVESTGVLAPEDIVKRALAIFTGKLKELSDGMMNHRFNE